MPVLSIVLPAYNEEAMLKKTADILKQILSGAQINYELVFVDDGSKDATWRKIEEAAQTDPYVHGIVRPEIVWL